MAYTPSGDAEISLTRLAELLQGYEDHFLSSGPRGRIDVSRPDGSPLGWVLSGEEVFVQPDWLQQGAPDLPYRFGA